MTVALPDFDTANARTTPAVTRQEGWYLLSVHRLSASTEGRIRTGELSEYLDVEPASVTQMVTALAADGLLDHEKHRGVRLTETGESVAADLARRQCVVVAYFEEVLDAPLAGDTAYRIGYTLPASGIDRLAEDAEHPCGDAGRGDRRASDGCPPPGRAERPPR